MSSLFGEICHIFCCPPRPSHIVAKFAFLPPIPTYTMVQSSGGSEWQIIFKPQVGPISDYAKSRMEVFYTMTKRKSRIACLYIHYDPTGSRHTFSTSANGGDPESRITILFSHGNAVDIGQMAGFLFSLSQRFGVNVLVYDYSGYGASTGQTLEANLYADGEAALVELRERYLCPLNRIVLYGQSIGTAPTVELATHYAVAGVVLHSALMSGLRVVCPGTTRRFCFDPFNSIDKVEHIQSPTLVIHGTDDHVIGLHHGKELYARLPNPLEPLWVDGADHNNIELFHEYTIRLEKFFQVDMRQAVKRSPDVPVKEHSLLNMTVNDQNRSTAFDRNALKLVDERRQRHSWNSTVPLSPLNVSLKTTPFVTTSKSPTAASLAESQVSPSVVKSPRASYGNHIKVFGVDAATTGSSISLPLDTNSESARDPLDHEKTSGKDRSTSEWVFQSAEKQKSPLNQNQDL
ncbi:Alpha/beta hydrolase domain-containing protein 17C [Echinococcus granulosus]|uniref:Phospholipase carboxylesterase n=2 Tax=Echinococcus granulosus TaxID=6210 RepID=A0A068WGZ7_ECHGR|nr:Alpha/beta hydrolase domain-containing protein 17C [Echinococcus granulosus]CDS16873.1 Phospholipase carboxylesterase [Echinococcus granulosus]